RGPPLVPPRMLRRLRAPVPRLGPRGGLQATRLAVHLRVAGMPPPRLGWLDVQGDQGRGDVAPEPGAPRRPGPRQRDPRENRRRLAEVLLRDAESRTILRQNGRLAVA